MQRAHLFTSTLSVSLYIPPSLSLSPSIPFPLSLPLSLSSSADAKPGCHPTFTRKRGDREGWAALTDGIKTDRGQDVTCLFKLQCASIRSDNLSNLSIPVSFPLTGEAHCLLLSNVSQVLERSWQSEYIKNRKYSNSTADTTHGAPGGSLCTSSSSSASDWLHNPWSSLPALIQVPLPIRPNFTLDLQHVLM